MKGFKKRITSIIAATAVAFSAVTLPENISVLSSLTIPAFAEEPLEAPETPVSADAADASTVFGTLNAEGCMSLKARPTP